jgi:hypothetical protein
MNDHFILQIFNIIRYTHIFAGFLGFISFWSALFLRHKTKNHQNMGTVFLLSMSILSMTALTLSALTFCFTGIVHPEASSSEAKVFSLFLSLLGILSAVSCLNGWTAVKLKNNFINFKTILVNIALAWISISSLFIALISQQFVIAIAGILGLNVCFPYLREWLKPKSTAYQEFHLNYMIGSGIALHTAFIAGGGSRFMPNFIQELGWVSWVIPTLLFQPILLGLKRKWR